VLNICEYWKLFLKNSGKRILTPFYPRKVRNIFLTILFLYLGKVISPRAHQHFLETFCVGEGNTKGAQTFEFTSLSPKTSVGTSLALVFASLMISSTNQRKREKQNVNQSVAFGY
jgi:uncharacterized membrane protein YfcA